jgi:hypothetical protein
MREFLIHASKLFFFDLVLPLNNTWNLEVRMVFRYPAILPALSVFKSQGRESGCLHSHSSMTLDYNIYHPVGIRPYSRSHVSLELLLTGDSVSKDSS